MSLTRDLMELKIPVVFYDVGEPRLNIINIAVDYAYGIEQVGNHLHELGRRRIAFVSHHPGLGPLSVREQTFCEMAHCHECRHAGRRMQCGA